MPTPVPPARFARATGRQRGSRHQRGIDGSARDGVARPQPIGLGSEPARMAWFARDPRRTAAPEHREEPVGKPRIESQARWQLHQHAFELRPQARDAIEERSQRIAGAIQPRLVGDPLRQLRRKPEPRRHTRRPALECPRLVPAVEGRVDLCHIEARCVTCKVAVAFAKQMRVLRWNRPARAADAHRRRSASAHGRTAGSGRARPALSARGAIAAKGLSQAHFRGGLGAAAIRPPKRPLRSTGAARKKTRRHGANALLGDERNGSIRCMGPTCGWPQSTGELAVYCGLGDADHFSRRSAFAVAACLGGQHLRAAAGFHIAGSRFGRCFFLCENSGFNPSGDA